MDVSREHEEEEEAAGVRWRIVSWCLFSWLEYCPKTFAGATAVACKA